MLLSEYRATSDQTWRRFARAASRPGRPGAVASPARSAAPFSAPAEVPLIAAISISSPSSRRSRTPQAKAPCAPPP